MSSQIFNQRDLAEMAAFFEEVRHARLQNLTGGPRNAMTGLPAAKGVRPLDGIPPNNRGASIVLSEGQTNRSILEVRPISDDVPAEMLTVSVGAQPVNTSFAPGQFNPSNDAQIQGNLQWGIGQASFQAFFDFYRGTSISFPASFFSLSANYLPGGMSPPFQVSAGVGYGSYSNRSAPVRFTQQLSVIGAPGSITVQIPPFAVAFTVQTEVGTPPAAPVELIINVTDAVASEISTFLYNNPSNIANHTEQQFPIFNGAERIIITNNLLSSAGRCRIIYTLAL